MSNGEDWLQDPLRRVDNGKFRTLKSSNDEQSDLWHSFHFSTSLKLEAADYFCRQVLGAASMPDYQGLRLLAYRQLHWYLDAFFFELTSAYETLLQELNIVYAYDLGLEPKKICWDTKKDKLKKVELPEKLLNYMRKERKEDWFKNVYKYRNVAAHQHYIPTGSATGWTGEKTSWDYHKVSIFYLDDTGKLIVEKIEECPRYLMRLAKHIQQVWQEMAQKFH